MSAAQHPDRYQAVASFSGALDLDVPTDAFPPLAQPLQTARDIAAGQGWSEPNPIELVEGLEGLAIYLAYGDGEPGPFDDPERQADPVEAWIGASNSSFVAALEAAGIPAVVNDYGPGTHGWPYWERELELALPMLVEALGGAGSTYTISVARGTS
jgi:S-formylglutathione hydrolase FrmB